MQKVLIIDVFYRNGAINRLNNSKLDDKGTL